MLGLAGENLHDCHQAVLGRMIEIRGRLSKSQSHSPRDGVSQFSLVLCLPNSSTCINNNLFLCLIEAFDNQVARFDRRHIQKVRIR